MQDLTLPLQTFMATYGIPLANSVIAVVAARLLFPLIRRALSRLTAAGYITDTLLKTITSVIKWLMAVIVLLLVLSFFGVSVTSLWVTLSGVAALVALGFVAMWSVLSNVTCSVLLVVFAPFRIGDEIEVQDPAATVFVRGRVIAINMMFTTLQAVNEEHQETGNLLRIPNNVFFQKYSYVLPGRGTTSLRKFLADQHGQQDSTSQPTG